MKKAYGRPGPRPADVFLNESALFSRVCGRVEKAAMPKFGVELLVDSVVILR